MGNGAMREEGLSNAEKSNGITVELYIEICSS
jgi:hypothetical protein